MEALLENLNSFEVTHRPNNPDAEHPRYSQYKSKTRNSCQEERRKKILNARKLARYDLLTYLREVDESSEEKNEHYDHMDVENPQKVYAKPNRFRDFILQSEWLVDVPNDFSDTYLAMPCPVGKRCLVVTHKGYTHVYTKSGFMLMKFPSHLPGGKKSPKNGGHIKRGATILDCIYNEYLCTFYILDMVCWNNMPYLDCDSAFRFQWLRITVNEYEEDISETGLLNRFSFQTLPYCMSNSKNIGEMLQNEIKFDVPIDGILFYHQDTHYTHGPSPLVCWLKVFMLPEMLNVKLPENLESDRPNNYTTATEHIKEYEAERKDLIKTRRKNARKSHSKKNGSMEIEEDSKESYDSSTNETTSESVTGSESVEEVLE